MKKIILLLISLSFLSCSLDDGNEDLTYHEFIPIETVNLPEFFNYGVYYDITVTYIVPNDCYAFYDIYYEKNNNERIVAVINTIHENSNCTQATEEKEVTFTVHVTQEETYVFNFWQGVDDNGEDVYLIIEVPVEQ